MELLRVFDFIPPGAAAGVVVGEITVVLADGSDDVIFHDLHVIDIEEQAATACVKLSK